MLVKPLSKPTHTCEGDAKIPGPSCSKYDYHQLRSGLGSVNEILACMPTIFVGRNSKSCVEYDPGNNLPLSIDQVLPSKLRLTPRLP